MSNRTKYFTLDFLFVASLVLVLLGSTTNALGQEKVTDLDRERGRTMLKRIKDELKQNYYDPKFHGMDVETASSVRFWCDVGSG